MKGFKFVADDCDNRCAKCAFLNEEHLCETAKCRPHERNDKRLGYFVSEASDIKCESDLPINHTISIVSCRIAQYNFENGKCKAINSDVDLKGSYITVWVHLSNGECQSFPSLSEECIAFYNSDKGE